MWRKQVWELQDNPQRVYRPREVLGASKRVRLLAFIKTSLDRCPMMRGAPNIISSNCEALCGPVLRATARLSQRYPHIPCYGVWGVSTWRDWVWYLSPQHAHLRCDTPRTRGVPQPDLRDTTWKQEKKSAISPLRCYLEGYCAVWGGIWHWAAKVRPLRHWKRLSEKALIRKLVWMRETLCQRSSASMLRSCWHRSSSHGCFRTGLQLRSDDYATWREDISVSELLQSHPNSHHPARDTAEDQTQTHIHTHTKKKTHTHKQTNKQTNKQANKQKQTKTNKQAGNQRNKQTHARAHTHTHTHTTHTKKTHTHARRNTRTFSHGGAVVQTRVGLMLDMAQPEGLNIFPKGRSSALPVGLEWRPSLTLGCQHFFEGEWVAPWLMTPYWQLVMCPLLINEVNASLGFYGCWTRNLVLAPLLFARAMKQQQQQWEQSVSPRA